MEFVNIATTQNIDIQYKRASIGERIFAYAIDIFIFICWSGIWAYIFNKLDGFRLWQIIFTIPIMVYSLVLEMIFNGKTVGKMLLNIRAVKLNGSELTIADCLLRWSFRIIDVWISFACVGIISIIVSKKSQRLGDLTCGTTVVRNQKKSLFEHSAYMHIPEDYSLVYHQVHLLTDEDALTIKEVLNITAKNTNDKYNNDILIKTKNAIQEKLQLEDQKAEPAFFLETILKDYNYLNQ